MWKPLLLFALVATGGSEFSESVGLLKNSVQSGYCLPGSAAFSRTVFGKVRKTVTDPRLAPVRDAMRISQLPSDSVVLVTDEGVCRNVALAIGEFRELENRQLKLVVVRIGPRLWAEDGQLLGGESPLVFILDSTATRVISQH